MRWRSAPRWVLTFSLDDGRRSKVPAAELAWGGRSFAFDYTGRLLGETSGGWFRLVARMDSGAVLLAVDETTEGERRYVATAAEGEDTPGRRWALAALSRGLSAEERHRAGVAVAVMERHKDTKGWN